MINKVNRGGKDNCFIHFMSHQIGQACMNGGGVNGGMNSEGRDGVAQRRFKNTFLEKPGGFMRVWRAPRKYNKEYFILISLWCFILFLICTTCYYGIRKYWSQTEHYPRWLHDYDPIHFKSKFIMHGMHCMHNSAVIHSEKNLIT